MSKCPADAPNAGKSSEGSASAPGTELPNSSEGLAPILSALLSLNESLKQISEHLGYMAYLMSQHDQTEEDEEPGAQPRDISGRPIQ